MTSIVERFSLDGQVAVVTGAGRGIGEGIALDFADAGAKVALAARRTEEICLLYTSPSPRDRTRSRMPSSA